MLDKKSAVPFLGRTALNDASINPLFPNSGTDKTYGDFERLSLCRSAFQRLRILVPASQHPPRSVAYFAVVEPLPGDRHRQA